MGCNFYYGSDSRVVEGSKNFAARVGESPESFGLSQQQADEYQALDAVLQEKYSLATTPGTRTSIAIVGKEQAMRAVQRRAAVLAAIVAGTETVDDSQLVSLGLVPRPTRRRLPVPAAPPTVEVGAVRARLVSIRIHARTTEGRRLAEGAIGALVYTYVGEEPPSDSQQYHLCGLAPRATMDIVFPDDVPNGATAYLSACWISRRGERGRACGPVRVTIQGGPVTVSTGKLA